MPDTMRAVRIHGFGGAEALTLERVPIPRPAAGEVLVRACAAGVNPIDWYTRQGAVESLFPHRLPLILGWDVSGLVEALGDGVRGFDVGAAVFGRCDFLRDGAYAEFVAVPADQLVGKPQSINHVEAAAVPIAAVTPWAPLAFGFRAGRLDQQSA